MYLDRRGKKDKPDNYKFNLTVRVCVENDTLYLNIPKTKLTLSQYELVFIKKINDTASIEFRETCNGYVTKCEKIFNSLQSFNREKFRELFYKTDDEVEQEVIPVEEVNPLKLKVLFDDYITHYKGIGIKAREHYGYTIRTLEKYKPGITVWDITTDFLNEFDDKVIKDGSSNSTMEGFARDIRRIINYNTHHKKIIPKTYEYPFGRGGYSISSTFSNKIILKQNEIQKVVDMKDFDSPEQEFARDIWLFLYRCNGINFCDLLRLKWSNKQGDYYIFTRKKTERSRKNNIKPVVAPITEKLQEVIDKIGDKDSPFLLGKLYEGYTDVYFNNKSEKLKKIYNIHLKAITKKLNLSVKLNVGSARHTYATTLLRNGVSKDSISEMLVHSNSIVTEHYLGSMDQEKTFDINKCVL